MPAKKYRIRLTEEERSDLRAIADSGLAAKERRRRANILLMCDEGEGGAGFVDSDIASAVSCTARTVERTREDCFRGGPSEAVDREKRAEPPRERLLAGRGAFRLAGERLREILVEPRAAVLLGDGERMGSVFVGFGSNRHHGQ